uniref:PX domain-containing protein n=1 Tax=Plectus sambesii TaxID=2011161 RepID=A0A914W1X3_9BILA
VYIRIANEEWNVYRRYSDFLKLHQLLCKQDSAVSAFKFPPKKKVGKKEKAFVEERRRALEAYLRMAINHVVQTFPEFTAVPVTKETLSKLLTFLNDV